MKLTFLVGAELTFLVGTEATLLVGAGLHRVSGIGIATKLALATDNSCLIFDQLQSLFEQVSWYIALLNLLIPDDNPYPPRTMMFF